jgi:hypothetical protein
MWKHPFCNGIISNICIVYQVENELVREREDGVREGGKEEDR